MRSGILHHALGDLLDALLPSRCAGCDGRGPELCAGCRSSLRPAPVVPPPPGVSWWVAPFTYEGAVREVIARAKYRQQRAGLSWLASCIANAVGVAHGGRIDAVTWVPASAQRRDDNGVDHGELLARHVARRRDLPVRRLLVRDRGRAQTGRPALERHRGPHLSVVVSPVPRAVLVIDDVATTGATATASAQALRSAGAEVVAFATAARTPRRR